jgi:hypothetical protein
LQIKQKQSYKYADIELVNTGWFGYLIKRSKFELDYRQVVERMSDGLLYTSHYLLFSSDIYRYKPVSDEKVVSRIFYLEPVFIFQNNDWRGLQWRYQTGLFLYPSTFSRPKIKLDLGLGFVYDWSSWEVNNQKKIDAAEQWVREIILFVNSHSKLVKNMYMRHHEFRPTLMLYMNYQLNNVLNFNLVTSYQQSLASPFSEEIKAEYPRLAKVYPYTFTRLSASVKVFEGFAIKSTFVLDYENNNLSMYESSWEYSLLFGVTWNFVRQKKLKE